MLPQQKRAVARDGRSDHLPHHGMESLGVKNPLRVTAQGCVFFDEPMLMRISLVCGEKRPELNAFPQY